MHSFSANRLLLISAPSLLQPIIFQYNLLGGGWRKYRVVTSLFPVAVPFSEPAKSMNENIPFVDLADRSLIDI